MPEADKLRIKAIVTGAAGFIGSELVRQLLARPDVASVLAVDCLSYAGVPASLEEVGLYPPGLKSSNPRFSFAKADVRDSV